MTACVVWVDSPTMVLHTAQAILGHATFRSDLRDRLVVLQAALVTAVSAGPALPALPSFPPAALPQPSALRLAVDIACISGQALCEADEAAFADLGRPAGLGGSPGKASCAGQERNQARSGLAAWVTGAALECELRSAWVRTCSTHTRSGMSWHQDLCRMLTYVHQLLAMQCISQRAVLGCQCIFRSTTAPRSDRRILAVQWMVEYTWRSHLRQPLDTVNPTCEQCARAGRMRPARLAGAPARQAADLGAPEVGCRVCCAGHAGAPARGRRASAALVCKVRCCARASSWHTPHRCCTPHLAALMCSLRFSQLSFPEQGFQGGSKRRPHGEETPT